MSEFKKAKAENRRGIEGEVNLKLNSELELDSEFEPKTELKLKLEHFPNHPLDLPPNEKTEKLLRT